VQNADLENAVTAYNQAIEDAVKDVARAIQRQLEEASKKGELQTAKRFEEAHRAVAEQKLLPRLHDLNKGARNSYDKAVRRATQQCSSAYEGAIRDYTKNREIAAAEKVRKEYEEFLAHPSHRPLHVPTQAVGFRGHWYLVSQESLPLEPALSAAQKYEGHLLVIDDLEENEFIQPLVEDTVRLGLLRVGNVWMTPARKPATFFVWDNGQPQNIPAEMSAAIHVNGKWHDWPAARSMPYCIEWD
jgi:hypothetical protein